ncbi:hypothetical protein M3Y98_00196800 [Aphelenchoides besseyi]|nr:hypothetical protein M3Y98_00196800 [Aphelenchoides besseyi]KAI6200261.1 hypothetical protein M3Y96_00714600 [Aphelenchoides besseyi]
MTEMRLLLITLTFGPAVCLACLPLGTIAGDDSIQPFELTNSPRFTLVYSPPVGWTTASKTPTTEQAKDVDEAKVAILISIVEALRVGFASLNAVIPSAIEYNVDEFVPQELTIATNASPADAEGIVEFGVVTKVCRPIDQKKTCENGEGVVPLILNHTLSIIDGPLLNGQQWMDVSNKLFSELSSSANVYFRGGITLRKN